MVVERVVIQQWRVNHVQVTQRGDGIVEYVVDSNAYISLEDQMAITQSIQERLGTTLRYAMIVDTGDFTTHSPESTRYARSQEHLTPFVCIAVMYRGLAIRLAMNFYVRVFKPTNPYRMFAHFAEAEEWCREMLDKHENQLPR